MPQITRKVQQKAKRILHSLLSLAAHLILEIMIDTLVTNIIEEYMYGVYYYVNCINVLIYTFLIIMQLRWNFYT